MALRTGLAIANLFAMAKRHGTRTWLVAAVLLGTVTVTGCAGGPSGDPEQGGSSANPEAVEPAGGESSVAPAQGVTPA